MKKILAILIILTSGIFIQANPVTMPGIIINEIYFDSTGNWQLELLYTYFDEGATVLPEKSLALKTSNDTAYFRELHLVGSSGYLVVTQDSLLSGLTINPQGDNLELLVYENIYVPSYSIDFGSVEESHIKSPGAGESIARHDATFWSHLSSYSIDKTPTLGIENDTSGMCGTITGKIYDIDGKLVLLIYPLTFDYPLVIDSLGNYTARIFADSINCNKVTLLFPGIITGVSISRISFFISPDSTVTRDIHLSVSLHDLDSLINKYNNIDLNASFDLGLHIFPNPVSGSSFNYRIEQQESLLKYELSLINIKGVTVSVFHPKSLLGTIALPESIKNGIYFVQLRTNNKVQTIRILVNR